MIPQTAGPVNPIENKLRRPSVYNTSLQANQEQIAGSGEDSRLALQQARQSLGVPVSEQEWDMISTAAITSENPQEEMLRYASAIRFSREYDLPISAAIQNLDSLTEYQIGQKFSPDRSAFQAIGDSMRIGKLSVERSEIAAQIREKHYEGGDVTDLVARMQEIDADIEANQDHLPRNLLTRMAKFGAQLVPYTMEVFNSGGAMGIATAASVAALAFMAGVPVLAGGAAALTAGAAGAASTAPLLGSAFAVGQTAGVINRSRELQRGIAYYEMVNAGVDKDTAFYLSEAEGTIYGVIESMLNMVGGAFLNAVGIDTFISRTASSVMGKLTAKGTLGTVGLEVSKYLLNAAGEGVEETAQSLTSSMREAITTELTGVLPEDSRGMVEKAVQEGVQGFLGGLLLGLPVGGVNAAIDISRAKQINELAKQVPSRAAFVKATEGSKPEGIEMADWNQAMVRTWNRYNGNRTPSVIQDENTAVNELDAGKGRTPSGVARRLQDGSLYTQEIDKVTTDSEGVEHHTIKVGDPLSGARYGAIDYAISGNTLTIEDVRVREGYEDIRKEAILGLARQYEGYDIQWEAKGENLEAIKQQIVTENPRGPEAGLQYYDGITDVSERMRIQDTVAKAFPNLNASEQSLASTILQLRAQAKGMTADAYISQYGKDGTLFESADLGMGKKGAVSLDRMGREVKAVVYAGQNADFSTFTHESFHLFRNEMEQTTQLEEALSEAAQNGELERFVQSHRDVFNDSTFKGMSSRQIAEAVSRFDEEWSPVQEEISARLWEAYLLGGQTQSAKLKNIFRRIAEWMRKIYDAIRNQVQLNQKIVEVFDSLLDADTPLAKTARKEQQSGNKTQEGQAASETVLYQKSNESRNLEDRISGDDLLDVQDMIEEIRDVGALVDDLGIVTVYHATSKTSANNIESTGRMVAKEDGLFFSTKPDGQISGYGESVVKLEIPAELLIIDDLFDDEAHLVLELGRSRSRNVSKFGPTVLFQPAPPTDSEAFKAWFGDSKVVDENGKPLVVYHGTLNAGFNEFDMEKHTTEPGFFFSDNPNVANEFTLLGFDGNLDIDGFDDVSFSPYPAVYPVYLSLKNPLIVDMKGETWSDRVYDIIEQAYKEKMDGVIFKNFKEMKFTYSKLPLSTTYAAFSPTQIKSVNNQGSWDASNPNILFQEATDAHAIDLAREAETWEDFKESYIIDIGMDFDAFVPEDDVWYQDTFNRAHGIQSDITLEQEPETASVRIQSEQEKDDYFADIIADDEKLKKFVREMGFALTDRSLENASVADAEEAAERDRLIDLRYRIEHEVTPFIMAIALRSTTSKDINPTSLKAVRAMMTGDGIRFYRDLYADTMQDRELKPAVIDERLPSIDDPGYEEIETLSITERIRLADDIEAEDLKQAILSGDELFAGQAEKVITKMDRDIAALNEQIAKMEQEINDRKSKLNDKDREAATLYEKISEAREALDKETNELRRKADADPKYQVDMANSYALQSKIDALHEQIKKIRVSDKVKATAKRQEALADLRRQLREKQREKDVARKVREYKIKLARRIMVKPSDAIDYEYRQKIYQIQAMLDPKFRRDSVVIEGDRMDLEDATNLLEGSTEEELIEALGERTYLRIMGIKKPLNDWTMAELEGVAQEVANLRKEGRQVWEAKQEQKRIVAENYQIAMVRSLVATGKYQSRTLPGSIEDDRRRKSVKERLRSVLYATWDADRWAQMIDNNKKGDAYELLVRMRRRLQHVEWTNIENRVKPVIDLMKSKEVNLKPEDLYQTVEISLSGRPTASVSYSYLMYAYLSQFNEQNRAAVAYGVLVSTEEKQSLNNDNDLVRQLGDRRYNELIMLAEQHLGAENPASPYMQVVEAIRQDLNSQAPRINEIAIREYNQPMRTLENYLPNHRLGATGKELSENIMDDLFNMNAGSMPTGVNRGFMQNRVNISPVRQTEVNMDLFGVWDKSMRQHEHMIAFAEYGRMLDRVFKNKSDGVRMLRSVITGTYGDALMSDIDEYVNEVINPDSFNRMGDGDRLLRALRGNLGAAYLAWKVSGLVLQGITSPMPFLADMNPVQLLLAYKDFMLHPIESWKFITERSQMMKNRSMNPIIQLILDRAKEQTKSRISKLNKQQQEIGAMGLTWVDRVSVAGGWIGAYRKKMAELQKQQGMTEEIRDRMASEYADEIVLRTQPTGDKLELSPLFKMGGEGMKIITQFQTSLNVIWKNLTYDIPTMVRNHETARIVGQITGYVLAGALLGAVAEGHNDDDDTAKEKLLNWLYWSTTQFSQSTPLLGNEVDSVLRSLVTGDKPEYFSRDLFPAASNILSGIVDITQENYGRAVKNLSEGFGYATGLPVSGAKQAILAVQESPAAVLGRR